MEIISHANEIVLTVLKRFGKQDGCARMLKYCVETPVDEGILLYNQLTRELVLLSREEYENLYTQEFLKERWFLVPEGTNEKELQDLVRWVMCRTQKKLDTINGYTIFTTTDCNARCFYCFELGRSRIPMSRETAMKTAQYIIDHCGGKKVNLHWFGGEPLFNMDAIDVICGELRRAEIPYNSRMITNGYLFDDEVVAKAINEWNLRQVQITLDGTETVYNRVKAYIYREGNPYQVVLKNMERLLDASIVINVRLNMDMHNAQNLLELVEELTQRFGGRKGIGIYAHYIFKDDDPLAQLYTDKEWAERDQAMRCLTDRINACGMSIYSGIPKTFRTNHCMADSGRAVTILPTGDIGLCEHYSESEFIGHLDRQEFDHDMVDSWREKGPDLPECGDCFDYPMCFRLKKCVNSWSCNYVLRQERLRRRQVQMVNEYRSWKAKETMEESDEDEIC